MTCPGNILYVFLVLLVGALWSWQDVTANIMNPNALRDISIRRAQSSTSSYCTCQSCTEDVWNTYAGDYTCGARIIYLYTQQSLSYPSEEAACQRIGGLEFPMECGACDPRTCDNRVYTACGCASCTNDILQRYAGDYTCIDRMRWVQLNDITVNGSEIEACRKVSAEFSTICGPDCDPDVCLPSVPVSLPVATPTAMNPVPAPSPTDNLYCFPPKDSRKRYRRVWDKYVVEVKESTGVCGPGDNYFSRNTVSITKNTNYLKLQYKLVNGLWTGSEVRVLRPKSLSYSYGTYRFSIKSVIMKRNGYRIAKDLPPSLVLGLFTWDPTEDYSIHENYNHEVDIEISRWNDTYALYDAQFLVQPPGSPQMKRFSTGSKPGDRHPGNNIYEFTWNPGTVEWNTTAGGAQSHMYTTQQAIQSNLPDYVQCLPANVEVRINLWNMLGAQQPIIMKTNDKILVEVIVDKFEYIPSGEIGVMDGNYCSKDCQCLPSSKCLNNFCKPNI